VKYLLDTHTWIWCHLHPERLSRRVKRLVENPERYEEMLLSAISVWELCKLLQKGRVILSSEPEEWLASAFVMPKFRLVPLSPQIAYHSTVLPGSFSSDPSDEIIVATAREEDATILTKDAVIREYTHVRTLW